ncbi:hypothetical protein B0H14DRAFT_3439641 [Mycena olivaceomarginata]|nr:hypothetical protein B0H14DRAFT_3439641 [Mycena olivaceomarginata]
MSLDNEVASPLESEFAAGLADGRRYRLLLFLVIIRVGSRIVFTVHVLGSKTRAANRRLHIPLPPPSPSASPTLLPRTRARSSCGLLSRVLSCPVRVRVWMRWDEMMGLQMGPENIIQLHSFSHSCALRSAPPGLGMYWMDAPVADQRRSLHAAPPPPPLSPIFHHHPLPPTSGRARRP